jgi:glycosyltransferase involved in cell wall biosynthesis
MNNNNHRLLPHPGGLRLKLAHAIHSGGFYGAEKVVCDLGREQMACPGVNPLLLAILDAGLVDNEVAARASGLGMPVIRMQAPRGLTLRSLEAYANVLRDRGIGLVHSHGYKATIFHLCSRWMGFHNVPLVVTAHGYPKSSGNWKATLYRWLDILFLGSAESVVAVSGEMERYLKARSPGCKVHTIPNGIRSDAAVAVRGSHPLDRRLASEGTARVRPPARVPKRVPVIGSAGRLVPMKNHEMLIRAYAEVRKTHPSRLVILGEGPLRPMLESLWRELIPDEPVRIYPFQAEILEWMADMDIFALPSNDGEGLPIALLEAGLLERAVVCSRSGGMPEIIRDGVTGRLCGIGDLPGLASALRDLVADPEARLSYGRALRGEVIASHDIRATHGRYLEAYAHALADA